MEDKKTLLLNVIFYQNYISENILDYLRHVININIHVNVTDKLSKGCTKLLSKHIGIQ